MKNIFFVNRKTSRTAVATVLIPTTALFSKVATLEQNK